MRKIRPFPAVLILLFVIVLYAAKAECQEYSWGGDTAAQIGEILATKRPLTVDRPNSTARSSDTALSKSHINSFTGGDAKDFKRYINGEPEPPSHYDYRQVLVTGVGATQSGITPSEQMLFDKIITLSPAGNSAADFVRAGVAHTLRVPTVDGAFQDLKGKTIETMVVHSWAYAETKNQVDLGSFRVKEIIAIDGVGSRGDNWKPPVGTRVKKYYDPQGFVPNAPPISLSRVGESGVGLKLTLHFGAGGRTNETSIPGMGHPRAGWEQVLINRGRLDLGPKGSGIPSRGAGMSPSRWNSQGLGGASGTYRPSQNFGSGGIGSFDSDRRH